VGTRRSSEAHSKKGGATAEQTRQSCGTKQKVMQGLGSKVIVQSGNDPLGSETGQQKTEKKKGRRSRKKKSGLNQ